MIAANPWLSPASSVNFTPFGSDALIFTGAAKAAIPCAREALASTGISNAPLISPGRQGASATCTGINADPAGGRRAPLSLNALIHFLSRFAFTPWSSA